MKKALTLLLLFAFIISFSQKEKTLQFVSITDNIDTCENLPIQLIVEFIDYDSLQWQKKNGLNYTSLVDDAIYTGANNDTLSFTTSIALNNSTFRCIAYNFNESDTIYSTLIYIKVRYLYPYVNDSSIITCFRDSVSLSLSSVFPIISCLWSTGENYYPIDVNPNYTTTYYVTATNSYGCVSTDSTIVNVTHPSSEFEIVDDPICQFVDFNIIAEDSSADYYYTIFQEDKIKHNSNNIFLNTSQYGIDTIFLYVKQDGCYSDTTSHIITSLNNEVSIIRSYDTLFASHSLSYQWYFSDTLLVGETDSVIQIDSIGSYKVSVENINSCINNAVFDYYPPEIISLTSSENPICAGDSISLLSNISICKVATFNNLELGPFIVSNSTPDFDNPCSGDTGPTLDGSPSCWIGGNYCMPRDLTTTQLDITPNVQICFDFAIATQTGSSPCEGPDEMDEGVSFQYSIDNGITWNDITYFCPDGNEYPTNSWVGLGDNGGGTGTPFNTWANYCYNVPLGAVSSNTMFQWHQEQITNNNYDHWGIDNIIICGNIITSGSIAWYDDDEQFISNDTSIVVSPSISSSYMTILDTMGYLPDTAYIDIIVNPLPEPTITQNGNILNTEIFVSYQWYCQGNSISGATSNPYTASDFGEYFVQVVDTNDCVNNSDTIYFTITLKDNIESDINLKIYPNPVKDVLTIESSQELNNDIKITDLSGRALLIDKIKGKNVNLNVSSLKKGIYLLQISETNEVIRFTKR